MLTTIYWIGFWGMFVFMYWLMFSKHSYAEELRSAPHFKEVNTPVKQWAVLLVVSAIWFIPLGGVLLDKIADRKQ